MPAIDSSHLTIRELEHALASADSAVLLAAPRILRRVIRFDRRLTTFGWGVPHRKSYVIARERLFEFVSRFELELDLERELPEMVILLERPDDEELLRRSSAELLADYWRLLFHIRVHIEFDQKHSGGEPADEEILQRLLELGSAEFAEIRTVLQREEMLLSPESDWQTYVEFAAVFSELHYFAPEQLTWWFPGIRDYGRVLELFRRDMDHGAIHAATRLAGSTPPSTARQRTEEEWPYSADADANADPLRPSPPVYWRLIARAERVGSVGNVVKAAILRQKAARQALPDRSRETTELAQAELERLARRLQPVLALTAEETQEWADALSPLLERADQGLRTAEAKVLYDLQKVCVEHERGVFKLDLIAWIRHGGHVPLRRNLPLLRQVLVTKHLQSAARKLAAARVTGVARSRLSRLIAAAVERANDLLRDRLRPQIADVLSMEGLRPGNVPERVAFRKIVEELLDRIVERGHLNLGQLRDTLSQNNLKLPDLTSLWELSSGDLLLRIDRRLASTLDGVYHRGPVYLRWSQRLSAMAFGTQFGRWLTQNIAVPFGGAYVVLEFARHIAHMFVSEPSVGATREPLSDSAPAVLERTLLPDPIGALQCVLLGTFFWLLIHRAGFRKGCLAMLRWTGQWIRRAAYDWPRIILRWPWVRRLLDSALYNVFVSYLFKPAVLTALILVPLDLRFEFVTSATWAISFLVVNLILNSPLGRYADEVITEQVLRGWRELQLRVFSAVVRAVIDLFQWLLQTIERLLYTVDEWLRFRSGESKLTIAIKAVLGAIWSLVAYLVRFCITLLVEPQVNPIKHFPVVTVSHKLIWPFGIPLDHWLDPMIGPFWAAWVAWATVFLLPGVFGFLVWELKENWRLYASNRSKNLRPIPIGRHGETLLRFLRLGFHSGTLPKTFGKLRQASRKAVRTGKWSTVHRHRDVLSHVEESMRHFVERELIALLDETGDWGGITVKVGEIHLATNRITLALLRESDERNSPPLVLEFQERAGWLIASVPQEGWLSSLSPHDRETFWRGFAGLFKASGVDILWQDVVKFVGFESCWYDFTVDGVLFWPQPKQYAPVLYRLRDVGMHSHSSVNVRAVVEPSELERPRLLFSATQLSWSEWVAMWNGPDESNREHSIDPVEAPAIKH